MAIIDGVRGSSVQKPGQLEELSLREAADAIIGNALARQRVIDAKINLSKEDKMLAKLLGSGIRTLGGTFVAGGQKKS